MEKRYSSQLLLSLQREGILRGGKTARLTSPFTSPAVKVGTQVSDSAMPSIQAFLVSEGKGDGIDMMEQMRQLFSQQQDDMRRTIETTIAHHIQLLSTAIAQERVEGVQAITDIQYQISELRAAFDTLSATPAPTQYPREARSEEVVIGGFGQKSKEGAISLVEKIIHGKAGDPYVVKEKTSQVPQVVPVKFASRDYAEQFVREHAGNKAFSHRFDGFWCNISQTPEDLEKFKRELGPLFKAKRAICEVMAIDGNRVVIHKIQKKIFFVDGSELRPVCQLSKDGTMQFESNIEQVVQDRYTALIADR